MCWFAMHPVDWLAVEAGRDVVGDAFAEGARHFVVVDAIVDSRLVIVYWIVMKNKSSELTRLD